MGIDPGKTPANVNSNQDNNTRSGVNSGGAGGGDRMKSKPIFASELEPMLKHQQQQQLQQDHSVPHNSQSGLTHTAVNK